jgi:hypothetical protein
MNTAATLAVNRGGGPSGSIKGEKTGVLGAVSGGSAIARAGGGSLRWSVAGDQGQIVEHTRSEVRTAEGPAQETSPAGGGSTASQPGTGSKGGRTEPPEEEFPWPVVVLGIVVVIAFVVIGAAK